MLGKALARFRRWLHLLRHFPNHRSVTWYRRSGRPGSITCDCGRVFWMDRGKGWTK